MRDLFGRPVYDAGPVRQPALFGDRHWFEAGYRDCWAGTFRDRKAPDAYQLGYEAARRDRQQDDRDGNCDVARAWRQAVAVGNVRE